MKTKHLFLLAALAFSLFSCEYPYDRDIEDCIVDFSYEIKSKTVVFESECVCAGKIENYAWDFGDGTIINAPGTSGIQTHTYSDAGTYDVTLVLVWKNPKNLTWSKKVTKQIIIIDLQ